VRAELGLGMKKLHSILQSQQIANLPSLVNALRIAKAKKLLLETPKTISEIGFLVGYNDPVYFAKVFKEQAGTTPSDFREGQNRPGPKKMR